jgi:hypothetical protein
MAISIGASATTDQGWGTTLTINKPASVADGDVMVAFVQVVNSDATITAPSGWTLEATANGAYVYQRMYWKVASSEGASYQWSWATASPASGGITRYSGVNTTTVEDVASRTNTGTSAAPRGLTITTATDGACVVMGVGHSTGAYTHTAPTGMTEEWEGYRTAYSDVIQTTAGASGNKDATLSGSDDWGTIIWALRPAASGGSTVSITAAQAAATGTGYSATVLARNRAITANTAASTGAGLSATISAGAKITAAQAASTAAGLSATVKAGAKITAAQAASTATGLSATVTVGTASTPVSITTSQAASTATGYSATISFPTSDSSITAGTAQATATGYSTTISVGVIVVTSTAVATAAGYTANIGIQAGITTSTCAATGTGYSAEVLVRDGSVTTSTAAAVALGYDSTVSTTDQGYIVTSTASAVGVGYPAIISDTKSVNTWETGTDADSESVVAAWGSITVQPVTGGDIITRGAISTGDSTNKWKLGGYTVGAPTPDGYVVIDINGTSYQVSVKKV